MRKSLLLVTMLAMVLAAAAPAFAQQGTQVAVGGRGDDVIQQCQNNLKQTAIANASAEVFASGDANAGAGVAINDASGATLVNQCEQEVNQGDTFIDKDVNVVGFTVFKEVEQTVFFDVTKNVFFIIVEGDKIVIEKDVVVFTVEDEEVVSPDVAVVSPDVAVVTADVSVTEDVAAGAAVLPATGGTGGTSLLALGAGALLVAGGLLARRILR